MPWPIIAAVGKAAAAGLASGVSSGISGRISGAINPRTRRSQVGSDSATPITLQKDYLAAYATNQDKSQGQRETFSTGEGAKSRAFASEEGDKNRALQLHMFEKQLAHDAQRSEGQVAVPWHRGLFHSRDARLPNTPRGSDIPPFENYQYNR